MVFSLVILAGAIMAAAGVIAESLSEAGRYNQLDVFGLLVVGVGLALLMVDLRKAWSADARERSASRVARDSTPVA
jgi:hypothetical protein